MADQWRAKIIDYNRKNDRVFTIARSWNLTIMFLGILTVNWAEKKRMWKFYRSSPLSRGLSLHTAINLLQSKWCFWNMSNQVSEPKASYLPAQLSILFVCLVCYISSKDEQFSSTLFKEIFFCFTNNIISLQVTSLRTMKTASLTRIYINCSLFLFLE